MAESYSSSLNSKLKIMKLNSYTLCFTTTAATALCFLLDSVASAPPRPNTIPDPLYTNKTQGDSKNYDGPFSLEFAKSWNASVNTDDSIEPLGNGNIVSKPGYKIMTGDNNNNGIINQYLIFYGLNSTSNTTTPRINLAKNLFSNIGATAFWTLVQEYEYSGMLPGKPAFNTSIAVPSIMNSIYGLNGSQLVRSDESRILSYLIDTKALPKDEFGIYTIFLDNSINYKVNGSILGDNFCGLHGIAENSTFGISNTSYGLSYTTVGIPNPTGKCAISYKLGLNQTANKDIAFDNALTIAIHELVEAVLNMPMYSSNNSLVYNGGSAFEDSIGKKLLYRRNEMVLLIHSIYLGYGPADKCENRYVNLDAKKTNSTLKIGSYNYLISPIWDIRRNKCSLGKSWKSAGCFM